MSRSDSSVRLIIAEKPSVARDIAAVVGARTRKNGYLEGAGVRVSWCVGHLAELCEPHEYDARYKSWSPANLPILPEAFKIRGTKSGAKQLRVLRGLLKERDVGAVINACDAGREGELIFRRVYEIARCKKPVLRLWISSLTEQAIRRGMAGLRPGGAFDNLADAAASRAEADWLVGMNGTRALTALARRGGARGRESLMSVGRVQTPTLAMIARREAEIEAFVKTPYWQVEARFSWPQAPPGQVSRYTGLWHGQADGRTPPGQGRDARESERDQRTRLPSADAAQAIVDAVAGQPGRVTRVDHREVREKPPLLFDLTTLQKTANQRFGMSAKRTLSAAQALYETHKALTYPRTDSRHLTSDMAAELPGVLRSLTAPYQDFAAQALARGVPRSRRLIDDSQVGDHHAIIPTDRPPRDLEGLSPDERRVYDLVVRRFLAAFMADAVFDKTRIETRVGAAPDDQLFVSQGRVMRETGWRAVEPQMRDRGKARTTRGADDTDRDHPLPRIPRHADVHTEAARTVERETRPPRRYTEATLLAAMEHAGKEVEEEALRRAMKDRGLGTPATRAAIIETLLKRDYIRREKKSLVPTARGRALIATLPVDDLASAELTGAWEEKLARMERGELSRARFMDEIRAFTTSAVEAMAAVDAQELSADLAAATSQSASDESLGSCPVCKTPVREGYKAYSCETGKDCSFVIFKRVAGRSISRGLVQLLLAGKTSQVLRGFRSKKGKRFQAALRLSSEGKVELVFDQSGGSRQKKSSDPGRDKRQDKRQDKRPDKRPPASASDATSQAPASLRCPACKRGRIIAGRRGWGCSRWRESCDFVVWFEQRGQRLPEDEAERLFRRGQTRLMDGLDQAGKARLVLDLDAPGNVRVELSKRARKSP